MIAIDSNLLVYSHREDSPFHAAAVETIEALRGPSAPWAIPWPCVHEFISVVTHPRIYLAAALKSWQSKASSLRR